MTDKNRKINLEDNGYFSILDDDIGENDIIDTRFMSNNADSSYENLPEIISGSYNEDYNILYIDDIIRKKLHNEKFTHLKGLKLKFKSLETLSNQPQSYVMRSKTLETMDKIAKEINDIESNERYKIYDEKTKLILAEYCKSSNKIKTVLFDNEDEKYQELDTNGKNRISLIDKYLDIARDYIQIDIIRNNKRPSDICFGCGESIAKIAINEDGTRRCPNCFTEHAVIIMTKLAKDGARLNSGNNTDDESIENFMKTFTRYQGLQPETPDESLYDELDQYFADDPRLSRDNIRKLPLNSRGRRGDTNHLMLRDALSKIGRPEYYDYVNYIGHIYWGWTLPNVMHKKERVIDIYVKTQRVFYQIPAEERGRTSSLGTQYRLWRILQLVGHECYMDEFKIAENQESLRIHNKLWKLMCEGANDPDIYYIP